MPHPRSTYHTIAGHEIHVTEWGDPHAPAIVMWHGLARVGRDFDTLAAHLAPRFRILCPDTIGRGLSSWSRDPAKDYIVPTYCAHAVELLDRLGIARARWVGTSMGGIIGMVLASSPETAPRIERLVLNDVGAELNQEALDRLKSYVAVTPEFTTMARFEAFLRVAYAPFGPLTDAQWRHMAETSVRRRDNGTFSAHYDPAVMQVFAELAMTAELWRFYDPIVCPTLVLRGEQSDLLPHDLAEAMTRRGPKARLEVIPGCGHAPMLNTASQIAVVEGFLAG